MLAAVDAPQLYLRLLEHEHVPAAALDQIREFEWDWSTVKIDWTLDVSVTLTAGRRLTAKEPRIDAILDVLNAARCRHHPAFATE